MHNKAAETDESLRLFDEFADSDTTKLRCQRCTNLIELRVKVGSSYINWSGARKQCPRESTEGIDASRRNVAKIVQQRNAKIREHNTRWWGADTVHHVFYEVSSTTIETIARRRSDCQCEHKPWASGKWMFSRTACQGKRFQDEMRTAYAPKLLSSSGVQARQY